MSFFVSGVATVLCIFIWIDIRGIEVEYSYDGSLRIILIALICYIAGLITFAAGRWIRMGFGGWLMSKFGKKLNRHDSFDENFIRVIKGHGLESSPLFKKYLDRTEVRGIWRLYVKLWAEIRRDEKYSNSLSFLKRYWVMAATYDGLASTFIITLLLSIESWVGVVADPSIDNHLLGSFIVVIQFAIFLACLREANRYVKYQVEEVVATIADGAE